jgi:lauroyl/myristoyl acyltransferase
MIRRYLELRRLGLDWYHWLGELLAHWPPSIFLLVCDTIGTIEWLWRRKASRRIARKIRRMLQLAGAPPRRVRSRAYFCAFWRLKLAHAYLALAPRPYVEQLVEVEGADHLEHALARGRGLVLASLHSLYGHLVAAYFVRRGIPTLSLRKADKSRYLGTSVEQLVFYGASPVFIDPSVPFGSVLKRSYEWLRQRNAAFFYVDGLYGDAVATVKIFDREVTLRPGVLAVASLAKAPLMGGAVLLRDRKLVIRFLEPVFVDESPQPAEVLNLLARAYEQTAATAPEMLPFGKFERRLLDR